MSDIVAAVMALEPVAVASLVAVAAVLMMLVLRHREGRERMVLAQPLCEVVAAPKFATGVRPTPRGVRPMPAARQARHVLPAADPAQQPAARQGREEFLRFLGDNSVSVENKLQAVRDILSTIDEAIGRGAMARTFDAMCNSLKIDESMFDATNRVTIACLLERIDAAGLEVRDNLLLTKGPMGVPAIDELAHNTRATLDKMFQRRGVPMHDAAKQSLLAAAASSPMVFASSAMATEGTGEMLGIDNPVQLIGGLLIFSAITAQYFSWASTIPDGEDDFFDSYDKRR